MRNHDGIHDGVSLYGRAKSVIPVSSETRFGLRQHLGIHLRRLVNVRRPTDRGGHSTYRRESNVDSTLLSYFTAELSYFTAELRA